MKKLIIVLIVLLSFSCTEEEKQYIYSDEIGATYDFSENPTTICTGTVVYSVTNMIITYDFYTYYEKGEIIICINKDFFCIIEYGQIVYYQQ